MKSWDDLKKLINEMEREQDLFFDCFIQIIDEEYGTDLRCKIYSKALERYRNLK